MKQKENRLWVLMRQAVIAVLLFVFLGQFAWAGVKDDIAAAVPLQQVIQTYLDSAMELKDLIAALDEAGISGVDIITGLFQAGQDHATVITAALDGGLSNSDVADWAQSSGATQSEIQLGYSMAGEALPPSMVFHRSQQFEDNAKEYLYNPPSQSK